MALSFAFDASAETPQSTATKRALIAQIMGSMKTPRNIGEGFSALGDGIVANVLGSRAAEAEKAGQASADDTFSQLVASITGQGATPSYGSAAASDATAAMGGGDFLSGLVNSESGGNWNALNDEGYGGRLQFGDARLADAAAAGIIPAGMTGADFSMMSPEVQQAVEQWHFGDIDQPAANMGLNQYFGQTIGGVPINADSIRAMAHLGGIGGARQFITSGGQYNPADSNGTRLSDYGTRFGGGGAAPTQVAQGPDLALLMEASANPWLSDSQKSVINSMIAQQMQQQDPAYQLGLEKLGLEVEGMRNPPAPQPEYGFTFAPDGTLIRTDATSGTIDPMGQFAKPVEPGFRQLSPEEVAQAGLDPEKSWQVAPTGEIKQIGGGGVNVSVNGERGFDKTVGEGYGKRFLEIQDSAQAAQRTLDGLSVMEQAMADPNFYSGSGEAYVSGLKRLGAAIGINPDSVSSNETFNAMAKQAALDSMGGSLGTGFSNADRDFVTDQVPTLSNTPEGNRKLIEIQRKLNERKQQIAEQARLYAQSHDGRIDAGFDDAIAQWARDNPLFPEAMTSGSPPQSTVSPSDIESLVQKYLVP